MKSYPEPIVNNNIRLCYFNIKTNKGVGYICMALERPEKDSASTTYRAAFAFCSPQEGKQFSKSKARAMALGRLVTFGRDSDNRIEFNSMAKNLNDVFTEGLEVSQYTKISIGVNPLTKVEEFKFLAPNWVRNVKNDILFGLNSSGRSVSNAIPKVLEANI